MLLGHLFEQVGDANLERLTTEFDRRFDCRTDVVGVHVAVVETISADHDDRVADSTPSLHELTLFRIFEVEQEHHFVAQLAHVYFGRIFATTHERFDLLTRRTRDHRWLWQRLTGHHVQRCVHEQQEACAASVDHTGFLQHRKLFGRVVECHLTGLTCRDQHRCKTFALRCCSDSRVSRLAHHREDRSLDRLQYSRVSGFARCFQRSGKRRGVGLVCTAHLR